MDLRKELEEKFKGEKYVTTESLADYLVGLQKKINQELENAYRLGWKACGKAVIKKLKEER